MDKTVRDVLERAFPVELVKTRKGSFGKTLAYVEVVNYVRRLNEAFGGDWSFEVLEQRLLDTEVVVVGKLTAGGITKTAFGGSSITVSRETGAQVSVSDDLKAAASDSLKKACSLLGVGLELHVDAQVPVKDTPPAPTPISPHPGSNVLTQRQYRASDQEREAVDVFTQILRAVDAEVFFPLRGWACAGCEFSQSCGG